MADQGKLTVGVELDANNAFSGFAEAVLKEVKPALQQVSFEMNKSMMDAISRDMDAGRMGNVTGDKFAGIGSIAAGSFIGSFASQMLTKGIDVLTDFARKGADVIKDVLASGFEQLKEIDYATTKLNALGKSGADIATVIQAANEATKNTAFDASDAITAATSAMGAGVKSADLPRYMKLLVDTAAVLKKSGEDYGAALQSVTGTLDLIIERGGAGGRELMVLERAGIPILEKLGEKYHITAGEMQDLATKTGVSALDIEEALEGIVGGSAVKMADTFEGQAQRVKNSLQDLGSALLQPFFDPATEGVGSLADGIDKLTEMVRRNMPEIIGAFGGVGQAIIGIGEAATGLGTVVTYLIATFFELEHVIMRAFIAPFEAMAKILDVVPDSLADMIPGFNELHGAVDAANNIFDAASDKVQNLADDNYKMADVLGNLTTVTLPRAGESLDQYIKRQQESARANQAYIDSQVKMGRSVEVATQAIQYQGNVIKWTADLQRWAANPLAGPMPMMPQPTLPVWNPGTNTLPNPVFTPNPSSGGKPDPGLLYPNGLPPINIPGVGPSLTSGVTPAVMPGMQVSIPGVSTAGLQPQSLAALQAIFGQFGGTGITLASGYRAQDAYEWHPSGRGIDIGIPGGDTQGGRNPQGKAIGDMIYQWIVQNADMLGVVAQNSLWQTLTGGNHYNHIHVAMKNGPSPLMAAMASGQIPGLSNVSMPGMPDMSGAYPGMGVWEAPDPTKLREQQEKIRGLEADLRIHEQKMSEMKADAKQSEIMAAEERRKELYQEIADAKSDLKDIEQGKYKKAKSGAQFSFDQLPFGHPLKIAAGAIMGAGGSEADARALLGLGGPGMMGMDMSGMGMDMSGMGTPFMMPPGVTPVAQISPAGAPTAIPGMVPVPGTPYYMPATQQQQMPLQAPVSAAVTAAGQPAAAAAGDIAAAFWTTPLPGPLGFPGKPTATSTDIMKLVAERNPLALAQMAGIDVPDYSRAGGGPGAQDLMAPGGLPFDAMGRMYSDTAALIDRTFTNLAAQMKAEHDQMMTVLNEIRARLGTDVVKPTTTAAVTAGIDGISSATTSAIGNQMGQAAAGPIASAVSSASAGSAGSGASLVNTGVSAVSAIGSAAVGMASGGAVIGPGSGTSDSILARVSNGEWVLTAGQVGRLGGFRGVQRIVDGLPKFATGGGVDVSNTVGAEFFGVGQIPIISTIVNLLVAILLKVIGVTIEARDTLNEISSDFRDFRGDFKAFDAYGRLMNDTSGLVDRTGSSEQAAADERIRILKLVLEGLFKFIVEKIIVPIAKAIGNSLLQAASGAAQGALGAAFPGGSIVGGAVGNVITSAGGAGIDIAGEVGTILAESIFSVALQGGGELLQSALPGITNSVFGGGLLAMIADPLAMLLSAPLNLIGGLLGGMASLIPGLSFDEGGVARGTGFMPKATISPERVLSPRQTQSFDRLVDALASGRPAAMTTIHAPFTVLGGERGGREVRDRLLTLMN